jgi:hypothetical protein
MVTINDQVAASPLLMFSFQTEQIPSQLQSNDFVEQPPKLYVTTFSAGAQSSI